MNGSRGTLLHRLIARGMKIPVGPKPYVVERGLDVRMRDGIRLKADHYAPADGSNKGTILVRGPYGRDGLAEVFYALPFATQGYHVVMQNCRSTFGSEGEEFVPAVNERDDAQDTVKWLREQAWYGGRFATMGGSYVGFTQWVLMQDAPEDLAAAIVIVGPDDLNEMAWRSGAFRLADLLTWTEELAWQEDVGTIRGLVRELRSAKRHRPVLDDLNPAESFKSLLKGRSGWFADWMRHPESKDEFWASHQAGDALDGLRVPVLLSAGWQDVILTENLRQFANLHAQSAPVGLTVGPWRHGLDLGLLGARTVIPEALQWLDEHLAGVPSGKRDAPVRVQVRGDQTWQSLPTWPPPSDAQTLFLDSGNTLSEVLPSGEAGTTRFSYDPLRPTPVLGGARLGSSAGYKDCRQIDERADVASFTGPVLTEPLAIAGTPLVDLAYACGADLHDLYVRLSEVDAKGRSIHVTDCFVRIDGARVPEAPLHLALQDTAYRFARGSRVRLVIAGGAHPVYARPLDAQGVVLGGVHLEARTYSISHDRSHMSSVSLPVVSWGEQA